MTKAQQQVAGLLKSHANTQRRMRKMEVRLSKVEAELDALRLRQRCCFYHHVGGDPAAACQFTANPRGVT